MPCQQVEFARERCLVEVEADRPATDVPMFTARVAVVEEDGAIVRPIVTGDGHRIEIHADSETDALDRAIRYLEDQFGRPRTDEHPCWLGAATIGLPFRLPR